MSFSSSNGAAAGPEQHYTTTSSQTGQGMSSAQAAQAAPSAQQTPAKRKRDKDGNDTDSDCDGQDDPKTRPLDQQQLAELTDLTSHTKRFEFETTKMEVAGLLQWHYTDTARTSKLVYDTKYQRNQNAGWDPEKKSQFLKTVMAGQAATPFVVNIRRKEARLMDGGHRLQTIVAFIKDEIPMDIGMSKAFYSQLPEQDQDHFNSRKLQVMEFRNLPFKDEVNFFIQLNSGLELSIGERLNATTSCNPATKVADLVVKEQVVEDDVKMLTKMLGKDPTNGRKDDLLALSFFVMIMFFRKPEDAVNLTIADTFLKDVCKLNEGAEWNPSKTHNGKTLDELKNEAIGLLKRTLNLYTAVARPKDQTDFRCLITCMLAVREIKEDDLRAETLSRLMASTGSGHLSKIFTGKSRDLKVDDIQAFLIAYRRLVPAPPPPCSQRGGPTLPPGGA